MSAAPAFGYTPQPDKADKKSQEKGLEGEEEEDEEKNIMEKLEVIRADTTSKRDKIDAAFRSVNAIMVELGTQIVSPVLDENLEDVKKANENVEKGKKRIASSELPPIKSIPTKESLPGQTDRLLKYVEDKLRGGEFSPFLKPQTGHKTPDDYEKSVKTVEVVMEINKIFSSPPNRFIKKRGVLENMMSFDGGDYIGVLNVIIIHQRNDEFLTNPDVASIIDVLKRKGIVLNPRVVSMGEMTLEQSEILNAIESTSDAKISQAFNLQKNKAKTTHAVQDVKSIDKMKGLSTDTKSRDFEAKVKLWIEEARKLNTNRRKNARDVKVSELTDKLSSIDVNRKAIEDVAYDVFVEPKFEGGQIKGLDISDSIQLTGHPEQHLIDPVLASMGPQFIAALEKDPRFIKNIDRLGLMYPTLCEKSKLCANKKSLEGEGKESVEKEGEALAKAVDNKKRKERKKRNKKKKAQKKDDKDPVQDDDDQPQDDPTPEEGSKEEGDPESENEEQKKK
jgi:hypothetical protein